MTGRRIEVVIDELTVRGVERADADTVVEAFRERLVALGEDRAAGAAPRGREERFGSLRNVSVPAGSPAGLGTAVAGAVADAVWETRG